MTNFLKFVMVIIPFTFAFIPAMAQVPQSMNYQAVARDAGGNILANQTVGLRLSILAGSGAGTAVYVETQTTSTNQFGLFTIAIGSGTIVTGTFSTINWSTGLYWLKVEMDATGGANYIVMDVMNVRKN